MSDSIIGLHPWWQSPAASYVLAWERSRFAAAVADIFGYHALQLGLPALDALEASRIPHQWLALQDAPQALGAASLVSAFDALPFAASSLDLVVLPHSLEFSPDPHATLREVERVLVPEGRVVICGFNPASLWGLQHARIRLYQRLGFAVPLLPPARNLMGYWRMRDWLRLLSFEVEQGAFGCYRPGLRSQPWLERFAWMEKLGAKGWPILGAVYFLVAVKRVRGMRLLAPTWTRRPVRMGKAVPLGNHVHEQRHLESQD